MSNKFYTYDVLLTIVKRRRGVSSLAKLTNEEKEIIAEENIKLIHYVANSFRNTKIFYDDLYGAAQLGFTKALNSYDSERGAKFSTFAVSCMRNEIRFFLRKERKQSDNTVSYNFVLTTDKNGNEFELFDTLSEKDEGLPELDELMVQKESRGAILEAVDQLTEMEQFIMNHRYELNGFPFKTQKAISEEIGMSQANVSKMQKNCIDKIKAFLAEDYESYREFVDQYSEYIA